MIIYGTFSPFHQGHLDAMNQAEGFVREKYGGQYDMLGGYVIPCHPWYLYRKAKKGNGSIPVPNSTRTEMIRIGIEGSRFWMVDPYYQGIDHFIDGYDIFNELRKRVDSTFNFD